MAQYNKTLGKFEIVDLPPAPRGTPQIAVTFDIDANGIVLVSAKDEGTGKEQSITITGQSSLSDQDIEKMIADAEVHAAEDARRREEAEVRNEAETVVYRTEKELAENADLPGDDKAAVEDALRALRDALDDAMSVEVVRERLDAVLVASQTAGQCLYERAASSSHGESARATEHGGDAAGWPS